MKGFRWEWQDNGYGDSEKIRVTRTIFRWEPIWGERMRLKTLNRERREQLRWEKGNMKWGGEWGFTKWDWEGNNEGLQKGLRTERLQWEWGFTKWGWEGKDYSEGLEVQWMRNVKTERGWEWEWGFWVEWMRNVKTKRGTFLRVKEVYFRRLKERKTKKKLWERWRLWRFYMPHFKWTLWRLRSCRIIQRIVTILNNRHIITTTIHTRFFVVCIKTNNPLKNTIHLKKTQKSEINGSLEYPETNKFEKPLEVTRVCKPPWSNDNLETPKSNKRVYRTVEK